MVCYICFPMETYYKKIFYVGIAYREYPEKGRKIKKEGLSLKKLDRNFPYLLGEGRGNMGKLQIYFSLLPEYSGKTLFRGEPKAWKPEIIKKLLRRASEKAYDKECREQIIAAGLGEYEEAVPIELWAAWLYQKRPFESICVSIEQESGEEELRQLTELISPYLPRMKKVAFKGPRSQQSEVLEDYLYEEFGIVMTYVEKTPADMMYINLNRLEMVKFLDTVVKNGYNTDVD